MKRLSLLLLVIFFGNENLWAATKQAKAEGATQIIVPSTADVDALTVTQNDTGQHAVNITAGGVIFAGKTVAQFNALTPVATYQMFACTNCTRSAVCISSGVTTGAWVILVATGTFVGAALSGLSHCE